MSFTTQTFLFVFFPIFFVCYFFVLFLQSRKHFSPLINKTRLLDLLLIIYSLAFYAWACFDDIFRLLVYIVLLYLAAHIIQRMKRKNSEICLVQNQRLLAQKGIPLARLALFGFIACFVFYLIHFKYTALLSDIWNFLFRDTTTGKSILAPLGISFITFSAISYLADVYFGKATAGSLIDCFLYITFFPKVVSGPIVLWRDFQPQIKGRKMSLQFSSDGLTRMMIGFAKKLILADQFGACISRIPDTAVDAPTAWGVALLYMLQIYFDFSGYSDIAIGLSKLVGFDLAENFHFPYLSTSISEFWRRWHISLGRWFREYIYFPLGGSRAGKKRTLFNLAVVFAITGVWHGAGWNYMLWGAANGIVAIGERLVKDRTFYKKTPAIMKWMFTMFVTFFCWELFRFQDFGSTLHWLKIMFGFTNFERVPYTWRYFFDAQITTLTVIGIFGSTVFGLPTIQSIYHRLVTSKIGYCVQQIITIVLFVIAILFMVNSTYSPFIYFQY